MVVIFFALAGVMIAAALFLLWSTKNKDRSNEGWERKSI